VIKSRQRWMAGLLGFLVFSIPLFGPVRVWAQDLPSDDQVRSILLDRVALGRNPGIVVGLLDSNGPRVVSAGSSGNDGIALDGNTVFEIGSITKVFTASILEDMVEKGEVEFEDPVAGLLPGNVKVPSESGRWITLLDLATHLSGLPRMPSNFFPADFENPYADYTVGQLYEFLSGYELERPIGTLWEYSNLGMGLLGHALCLKAGKTYETLVRERVLDPLGMANTGIQRAPPLDAPFAQGHGLNGQPVGNWDIPTFAGAGALRSTMYDMMVFATANLTTTGSEISLLLQRTQVVRRQRISDDLAMALAWFVSQRFPDRPIVWHNGGTGGFHSFIGLDRSSQNAVVILTNGTQSIDDIGFHLLDARSSLSPPEPLGTSTSGR
jgi:D-alanyl-D-alanine-carboxypeptidase/D-alanyl-D-alanine-endopeptidase